MACLDNATRGFDRIAVSVVGAHPGHARLAMNFGAGSQCSREHAGMKLPWVDPADIHADHAALIEVGTEVGALLGLRYRKRLDAERFSE